MVISIPHVNSTESTRISILKKGYVIVFLTFIILFIVGTILLSTASLIPQIDYGDPGYKQYIKLTNDLTTISGMLKNIAITLFTLSTFLGAISDRRLSIEVRRGMAIAAGIGVVALVLLNLSFQILPRLFFY